MNVFLLARLVHAVNGDNNDIVHVWSTATQSRAED